MASGRSLLERIDRPALLIAFLSLGAFLAGVLSEVLRIAIKGPAYAAAYWNDYFYYTAMTSRLWMRPDSLDVEIRTLGFHPDPVALAKYYDASSIHSTYLHAVNGLSHQPPYVY